MTKVGLVEALEADAIPIAGTAISNRALDETAATVLFKRNFISSSPLFDVNLHYHVLAAHPNRRELTHMSHTDHFGHLGTVAVGFNENRWLRVNSYDNLKRRTGV